MDALQRGERTRRSAVGFGDRQANARATVINRDDATARSLRRFLLWIDCKPPWTLLFELPSASAAFPALPVALLLHFFVEPGVFEEALHFPVGKTFPDGLRAIGNAPDGDGG